MSTIEPEVMEEGNRIEGNSIWNLVRMAHHMGQLSTYQSLVFGEKDGNTGVNLAYGQGDQHLERSQELLGHGRLLHMRIEGGEW